MAKSDPQVNVRMPDALLTRLRETADLEGRTLQAEIVGRLERSFPAVVEDEVRASRQSDLEKLRTSHQHALSDLEHYRSRLQAGDTAPYGMEWLQEVIRQCEYRAHRLARMIFRAENELDELDRELSGSLGPAGSDDPLIKNFEQRIEEARRALTELKSSFPSVRNTRQRAAIEADIAAMEANIASAEQSLVGVKRQVAAQSASLASTRAALRRAVEQDS